MSQVTCATLFYFTSGASMPASLIFKVFERRSIPLHNYKIKTNNQYFIFFLPRLKELFFAEKSEQTPRLGSWNNLKPSPSCTLMTLPEMVFCFLK